MTDLLFILGLNMFFISQVLVNFGIGISLSSKLYTNLVLHF